MNLLSLILVFLGLIVAVSICYIAWQLSSGFWDPTHRPAGGRANGKEPGESKESSDPPGS